TRTPCCRGWLLAWRCPVSQQRPAVVGERCTCGRQATVVFVSDGGEGGDCGLPDGGDRSRPCLFCGGGPPQGRPRPPGSAPGWGLRVVTGRQQGPGCLYRPVVAPPVRPHSAPPLVASRTARTGGGVLLGASFRPDFQVVRVGPNLTGWGQFSPEMRGRRWPVE